MIRLLFLICSTWLALQPLSAQSGRPALTSIAPAAFQQELNRGKVILLDVRTPAEFARGHLAGAVNLDYYDPGFKAKLKAYVTGKPVLVYCAVGGRSAKAAQWLQELKAPKVLNLAGGYTAWTQAGLPVQK